MHPTPPFPQWHPIHAAPAYRGGPPSVGLGREPPAPLPTPAVFQQFGQGGRFFPAAGQRRPPEPASEWTPPPLAHHPSPAPLARPALDAELTVPVVPQRAPSPQSPSGNLPVAMQAFAPLEAPLATGNWYSTGEFAVEGDPTQRPLKRLRTKRAAGCSPSAASGLLPQASGAGAATSAADCEGDQDVAATVSQPLTARVEDGASGRTGSPPAGSLQVQAQVASGLGSDLGSDRLPVANNWRSGVEATADDSEHESDGHPTGTHALKCKFCAFTSTVAGQVRRR